VLFVFLGDTKRQKHSATGIRYGFVSSTSGSDIEFSALLSETTRRRAEHSLRNYTVIKRKVLSSKKPGSRFDPKTGKYITYAFDIRLNKKRVRESGFETRKAAEEFVEKLKVNSRADKHGVESSSDVPLRQLFDKRLAEISKNAEMVRSRTVFDYFCKIAPATVKAVRRQHFQEFINKRTEDGVAPVTIRREMARLSTAFNRAPELFPKELTNYEPPRISRPKAPRRKINRRIISPEEKDAIAGYLRSHNWQKEAMMFELSWHLGLRYTETLKLLKSKYDRRRKSLEVERFKTDDWTLFEFLPEPVIKLLDEAVSVSNDPQYIFPHVAIHPNYFYERMKEAIEAAGIEYGRKPHQVSFHSCRHSFTTRMMGVADLGTVQSFTAHSDAEMAALYSQATQASRKKAMEKLYGSRDLRKVFDGVKTGSMNFEEFCEVVG
jgi:integrase